MQQPLLKLREHITEALNYLDDVLPRQTPIVDFVHHNNLLSFEHLPFDQALAAFEALTGICAYLPESQNRMFYRQGRIDDNDLAAAFARYPQLQAEQSVCALTGRSISRQAIYRIALLFDLQAVSISQLNWQIEELAALDTVQADVPEPTRLRLLAGGGNVIRQLWEAVLTGLGLEQAALHPENMLDLSLEQTENWLAQVANNQNGASAHHQMQQQAGAMLDKQLAEIGGNISLRGFMQALTGVDILDSVRPQLIRFCASGLDEGVAAWPLPERSRLGLYAAWRATARYDANPFLHELPDWQQIIAELPEDAIDTIILQLSHLEIPQSQWQGYLCRLALEVPGWSALINWRQHHPDYLIANDAAPTLADYLAIRLTLDRLWLNQVCRDTWKIEARLSSIQGYFGKNLSEFMVRSHLYQGGLQEYLAHRAETLTLHAGSERYDRSDWQQLADLIWTWQCIGCPEGSVAYPDKAQAPASAYNSGWRLFRLCQFLGLNAADLQQLSRNDLQAMLAVLDEFSITERSKIWLTAYEHHYRQDFFQAVSANHHRGLWSERQQPPEAQIIFCMDEREEGFRRHLEELNPLIETLGAAGFFGVAMNYKALGDGKATPQCPVAIAPTHEVQEALRSAFDPALPKYKRIEMLSRWFTMQMHQGLRRNLLLSHLLIDAIAPLVFAGLLAKSLFPKSLQNLVSGITRLIMPTLKTQLLFSAIKTDMPGTQLGFTDAEQAHLVADFLRAIGLTYGFSKLVVLMGHGSVSQNNPYLAAYNCGACNARHGGANARAFAAMANRPEIRELLVTSGINIPPDTWFLGSWHNTCNEEICWYDLDQLPAGRADDLKKLQMALLQARQMSAHERCRRLASAPRNLTPKQALSHVQERAADFSQVRPELGNATNAAAVVGRRSVTQGVFLDRRVFLISYDPTQDIDGQILEDILLKLIPIITGINLEYYFSNVNNEGFGCGSIMQHNITGFVGVMEGASSDLGVGLPRQMVEMHEPMRLQVMVEAKTAVLEAIVNRLERLKKLVVGEWLHLSVKDLDSGTIYAFQPGAGFVLWQVQAKDLPVRKNSEDCYRNQILPVAPVLIEQHQRPGIY